jgi:hypothetical protein
MPEKQKISCPQCQYFYVTWDKNFPKGCKVFRFKSKKFPSDFVYEATGIMCEHFAEKPKKLPRSSPPLRGTVGGG